ncbi:LOW QUALITY PROTEIN: protein timeless homolog [Ailuropoda melanoleuca]|uniref:LOW QUALITY PROTEIN: protein timeless homolog n=1 Tax=Ailuropoda melanoleuca TaxID=9646 RepID=UPI0014948D7D|nr:LOW QUALITY PROTEIN: protein timeless homolog [Ailuropoda melanoleuca]
MDLNMMNCELLATCSALGYLEGDTYHKEPDCLESVKDLIRYLRHEDDTRDVRQQLGAAQILQSDLLPILIQHRRDKPLFDAVIRLMVNLTQPALLCFGSVPKEPSFRHHFLQVLAYLQAYKEAFASEKAFGVLSETLYELLQLGWEERQEEDNLLIERILLLVRNILHVPTDLDQEKRIDDDASVHDQLLWAVHLSGLDDLLLFLASSPAEQQWSLHVLEIVSLMFRDQVRTWLFPYVNKRKKRKKKKKVLDWPVAPGNVPSSAGELEAVWPSLAEQLQCCAQDPELSLDSVVPFDAASEVPVEEQRAEAMVQIQDCLLAGQAPQALTLLRSAREVWPEGDVFGSQDISAEEELQLLKQILCAPLPRQQGPEDRGPEEEEEEEEEEEVQAVRVSEKEFNFLDYLKRFASSTVVRAYVLLLRGYRQNGAHTNHCIVKMLHRLAHDLKMDALLFQLSLFCLFNRLLSDPAAGAYTELVTFAKYILGKFFALAAVNQKAFVELLFWKNTAVVREMAEGYGSLDGGSSSRKPPIWTPEEEAQLQELYLAHKDVEGQDVVDVILAHLKTPRTRKQVIHQLVRLGLADSVKEFQRKGTHIVLWTEDQELELQRLFEEFQDSDDVLGHIMKNITARRSRARIVDKLLALGLVAERRELYKKRRKKLAPSSSPKGEESRKDFCQEDLEEEENLPEEESDEDEEKEEDSEADKAERSPVLSAETLGQSLSQEGFSAPLLWLQSCLMRVADDREEDGCSQPVPLVPLTEENEEAMENEQFQQLLRKLGVRPPASGQETFWRIPAKLSPTQLRRVAASLSQPEEELQPGPEPKVPGEQGPEEEHKKEHRSQARRALVLAQKEKAGLVSPEEEGAAGEKEQLKMAPRKRQLLDSDEEQEEDEGRSKAPESRAPEIQKKKRFQIEDEDESD